MSYPRTRFAIARAAWLVWLVACGDAGGPQEGASRAGRARGSVVARVNGVPIGSDDVRELAQELGLSPRDALTRLEEAALVEQHASALGYGRRLDVVREEKRAMVRAVLAATVEREVRPELIPMATVRERFEAVRGSQRVGADQLAQYEQAIREQLATEQRKVALAKLVEKLNRQLGVRLDEAEVHKLLADPALWGASP